MAEESSTHESAASRHEAPRAKHPITDASQIEQVALLSRRIEAIQQEFSARTRQTRALSHALSIVQMRAETSFLGEDLASGERELAARAASRKERARVQIHTAIIRRTGAFQHALLLKRVLRPLGSSNAHVGDGEREAEARRRMDVRDLARRMKLQEQREVVIHDAVTVFDKSSSKKKESEHFSLTPTITFQQLCDGAADHFGLSSASIVQNRIAGRERPRVRNQRERMQAMKNEAAKQTYRDRQGQMLGATPPRTAAKREDELAIDEHRALNSSFALVDASGATWARNCRVQLALPLSKAKAATHLFLTRVAPPQTSIEEWNPPVHEEYLQKIAMHVEVDERLKTSLLDAEELTRITADHTTADPRYFMADLIFSLLMLLAFSFVIAVRKDATTNYIANQGVESALMHKRWGAFGKKSFETIRNEQEFWEWVNGPLRRFVFQRRTASGKEAEKVFDQPRLDGVHVLLGDIQMYQVRVKEGICQRSIPHETARNFPHCWEQYDSWQTLPKRVFTAYGTTPSVEYCPECKFDDRAKSFAFPSEEIGSPAVTGYIKWYGQYGFPSKLPIISEAAFMKRVVFMRNNTWIDVATRNVMVKLNVYNPSLDRIVIVQAFVEFGAISAVLPWWRFGVLRLIKVGTEEADDIASGLLIYFDYLVCVPLICMVIVIQVRYGLLAYHLLEQRVQRRDALVKANEATNGSLGDNLQKLPDIFISNYILSFWTLIDAVIVSAYLVSFAFRIYQLATYPVRYIQIRNAGVKGNAERTVELAYHLRMHLYALRCDGVIVCCVILRMLKFVRIVPVVGVLIGTITNSLSKLWVLVLLFFVFLVAFAEVAMAIFGPQLYIFSNPIRASKTLLFMLWGIAPLEEMSQCHASLGPLFYFVFTFTFNFILINIFAALVIHLYATTVKESAEIEANRESTNSEFSTAHSEFTAVTIPLVAKIYCPGVYNRAVLALDSSWGRFMFPGWARQHFQLFGKNSAERHYASEASTDLLQNDHRE